jgi:hypothetical protein
MASSNGQNTGHCEGLQSGYDPAEDGMAGVLFAMGPEIKYGMVQEETSTVEVHGLLRDILGLGHTQPMKNYTAHSLSHFLKNSYGEDSAVQYTQLVEMEAPCLAQDLTCADVNCESDSICTHNSTIDTIVNSQKTQRDSRRFYKNQVFLGETRILSPNSYCLLLQENYMTAFSIEKQMPLYVAYITDIRSPEYENYLGLKIPSCYNLDPRTNSEASCASWKNGQQDEKWVPLFAKRNDVGTNDLSTNSVPMYKQLYDTKGKLS